MLRMFLRMLFVVAALCLFCTDSFAQCGQGSGGRAGFKLLRPFKAIRERMQERRAERASGAAQSAGGADADYSYVPDATPDYAGAPLGSAVQYATLETDIPAPAQYKAGAIAVYDGKVWRLVGDNSPVDIRPVPARAAQYQTVVPAGYHAHQRQDGTVIVHGDENFGDSVAHAGIAHPWPKIATAGQTVRGAVVQPRAQRVIYGSSCPGGVCPVR